MYKVMEGWLHPQEKNYKRAYNCEYYYDDKTSEYPSTAVTASLETGLCLACRLLWYLEVVHKNGFGLNRDQCNAAADR